MYPGLLRRYARRARRANARSHPASYQRLYEQYLREIQAQSDARISEIIGRPFHR